MLRNVFDFPNLSMIAAIAIGVPSVYLNNSQGLGFAGGLTTAAGTAYQYRNKPDNDQRGF